MLKQYLQKALLLWNSATSMAISNQAKRTQGTTTNSQFLPWPMFIVLICEHKDGQNITCPSGTYINILSALYGRQTLSVCQFYPYKAIGCSSKRMERVYQDCQGKQTCFMRATNSWFGDPCYGVWKYLEIEYQCLFKENRKNHLFQEGE